MFSLQFYQLFRSNSSVCLLVFKFFFCKIILPCFTFILSLSLTHTHTDIQHARCVSWLNSNTNHWLEANTRKYNFLVEFFMCLVQKKCGPCNHNSFIRNVKIKRCHVHIHFRHVRFFSRISFSQIIKFWSQLIMLYSFEFPTQMGSI